MARQLGAAGEEISFLGLIDTAAHYVAATPGGGDDDALLAQLEADASAVAMADIDAMLQRCRDTGMFPADVDNETLRRHLAVRMGIRRALRAYVPQALPVPVSLFRADQARRADATLGWGVLLGERLTITAVEGDHYSIMEAPHVEALGAALSEALLVSKQ
jgi:thioesterase domain-containing protein